MRRKLDKYAPHPASNKRYNKPKLTPARAHLTRLIQLIRSTPKDLLKL